MEHAQPLGRAFPWRTIALAASVLALGAGSVGALVDRPAGTRPDARSLVLFRPGWQREAERLARDSRIPTVAPLDGRVAPAYAHVPLIVILGAK